MLNIYSQMYVGSSLERRFLFATVSGKLAAGEAESALDDLEISTFLNVNPDGYGNSCEGSSREVDLNRHFSHCYRSTGDSPGSYLDDIGANDQPNLDAYRGKAPLSEPGANLDPKAPESFALDVHSFGQLSISGIGTHRW